MDTSVLIPVSPLNKVKSRLKNFLTYEERVNLIKSMLSDVYNGLNPVFDNVYVVSKDLEILNYSRDMGITTIPENENIKGLNDAIKYSLKYIKNECVAIVPADVPLICKENLRKLYKDTNGYSVAICPSRGGGTNLLIMKPKNVIDTQYEGFSFLKHIEECEKKGVDYLIYPSFYISIDINTVEDLGEVMIHGKGTNTYDYLRSIGIYALPKHSSGGRFEIKRK